MWKKGLLYPLKTGNNLKVLRNNQHKLTLTYNMLKNGGNDEKYNGNSIRTDSSWDDI